MNEIWKQRAETLLEWYTRCARDLPWRKNRDPYRIWVSEIMLQQTRVEAVIPYYERFLERFPSVEVLAEAEEDAVLKYWEGLGYYSRARNLKKAAEQIVSEYGGVFPETTQDLKKLPGFGVYTAGAVASIAFGKPEPAVDGNVLRVLARWNNDSTDIALPIAKKNAEVILRPVLETTRPELFNQALMDLGATVCLPNGEPLCSDCPMQSLCEAYRLGTQQELPVKAAKKARREEEYTIFILEADGKIAFRKRSKTGLLAGMWEFPNLPGICSEEEARQKMCEWGFVPEQIQNVGNARHIFSHVEWKMTGYSAGGKMRSCPKEWIWIARESVREAAILPSAFRYFTEQLES